MEYEDEESHVKNSQTVNPNRNGWSEEKRNKEIGAKQLRILLMKESLNTMGKLEQSSETYSLHKISPYSNGLGGLQKDIKSQEIQIQYYTSGNFVHEMTHAGQVEDGGIVFGSDGKPALQDVYDEIDAYKHQFAFDPESVTNLPSNVRVSSVEDITSKWLFGLTDNNYIYSNPDYKIGLIRVGANSTRDQLKKAFPWINIP